MFATFWLESMIRWIEILEPFCWLVDWLLLPPLPRFIFLVEEAEGALLTRCLEIFFWLLRGRVWFKRLLDLVAPS